MFHSGWHHQHQISGRFNGWGQGYIWKPDCHRRTHSAPLWEARCLPCECEGWKFCWTRPSHPLHSGHRSVKSSDLSEYELDSKAIASNFGTKWLVIYNTVRLKTFYWIIINNQAHVKIFWNPISIWMLIIYKVVHIPYTIYAVLSQ